MKFAGFRRSAELSWLGEDSLTDELSDFWVRQQLGQDDYVPVVKFMRDARDAFLAF